MFGSSQSGFSIADMRRKAKRKRQQELPIAAKLGAFLLLTVLLTGCAGAGTTKQQVRQAQLTDTAMGTIVSLKIFPGSESEADAGGFEEDMLELLRKMEMEELSYRVEGSLIQQVNENAGNGEGTIISDKLKNDLKTCLKLSEDSGGAFDVTLGALTGLWRIDAQAAEGTEGVIPSEQEIQRCLEVCGYEKLRLADERVILPEGVQLDLGSVGKGIALDRIAEAWTDGQFTFQGGVFSLGGSILTAGEKPDGSSFKVGIVDPEDPSGTIGFLSLPGGWFISTSGDYERYFEKDGRRYHHILDPETGYPARSGLRSVTIITEKSGLLSDALSTACFVLGEEKALELVGTYGAEILMVKENGEILCSDGMSAVFTKGKER